MKNRRKEIISIIMAIFIIIGSTNTHNLIFGMAQKGSTITENQPIMASYTVNAGDQFLYDVKYSANYYTEIMNFAYNESTNFHDERFVQNETNIYDKKVSYKIVENEGWAYLANKTEFANCTEHYKYRKEWISLGGGAFMPNETVEEHNYPFSTQSAHSATYLLINNITAFDIDEAYDSTILNYTKNYEYTARINGAEKVLNVSEYNLYAFTKSTYTDYKYDISFPATEIYETKLKMLVDNATGVIIHYDLYEYSQYNYSTVQYSAMFESDLYLERRQHSTLERHWDLFETNALYDPLTPDSDLPAVLYLVDGDPIVPDGIENLEIPVYIVDSSANLSANVYTNDFLAISLSGLQPGINIISIPEYRLWPNAESGYLVVSIEIWDEYNHYSSMWTLVYEDHRNFTSLWHPWIEGPEFVSIVDPGDPEFVEIQIYASTIWQMTVEYLTLDGWDYYTDQPGYKNMTYALTFDGRFHQETIQFRFILQDYSNRTTVIFNMTVAYYPFETDDVLPIIVGPSGTDIVEKGTISQLVWAIFDMHPGAIYLYDSVLDTNPIVYSWDERNTTIVYNIDPDMVAIHEIAIVAVDANNNTAVLEYTLSITEPEPTETTNTQTDTGTETQTTFSTTNETSKTDQNTVSLPFKMVTIGLSLSFLGIASVLIRKKRK